MPDPIRLYLDEDTINRALIKALRSRNIDVLTAKEADLIQAPDEHHLEYATSLDRTIFTFNARDFARLHTEYLSTGRHHTGIIISAQLPIGSRRVSSASDPLLDSAFPTPHSPIPPLP
jgi:hypothetical protein